MKPIYLDTVFLNYTLDQGLTNDEAFAELENDLVCSGVNREKARAMVEAFKKEFDYE